MKKIILCLTYYLTSHVCVAQWDLNDVSYLLPLPTFQNDSLLRMTTTGLGGSLLEPSLVEKLPPLTFPMTQDELVATLRVLAVRIDPCFPLPTPQSCQKQIRLVWQPIKLDPRKEIATADAAFHSFYKLTDSQFLNLLQDISSWKKQYGFSTHLLPLGPHPAWQYPQALEEFQNILRQYIGRKNIFRVTAMFLRGAQDNWAFLAYEFENGQLTPQPIPRLNGKRAQVFINHAIPTDHFEGMGMSPTPTGEDLLNDLLTEPLEIGLGNEDKIRQAFRAVYKIEHPHLYNPETMDCVSCHVAQPAKYAFLNKRPDLNLGIVGNDLKYKNSNYNLKNISPQLFDTQILRSFGYFQNKPVISQRVINESASVADLLNQPLARSKGKKQIKAIPSREADTL